jgi:3-deoxy-D-manno-octulosonate 8-phosphate phosphatase (KDO 8-P phosphatase)
MIKMLIMDVDGVLTDGTITIGDSTEESKTFNIKDGMGIVLAQKAGIKVIFLSGRYSKALVQRAKEIGVTDVFHNATDKLAILLKIMKEQGYKKDEIAYIGDDINDLPVLKQAGLPCTVSDAVEDVKAVAKYTSKMGGGKGAVREIIEHIIRSDGRYEKAVQAFFSERETKS